VRTTKRGRCWYLGSLLPPTMSAIEDWARAGCPTVPFRILFSRFEENSRGHSMLQQLVYTCTAGYIV
jgi:hypothetical protein